MEKADILEMTVAYLQVTHSRPRGPGLDVAPGGAIDRYAAGFRQCAVHVGQYLLDAGVNFGAVHERLMTHLDKALQAVVDVDGCGRLPGAGFETSTADVATSWIGDCDTTGRCSPDTDDNDDVDDCGSVSETVSDVGDVVRRQYAGCGTTATAADTIAATSTTMMTYRRPLHPIVDADSPRSADEFPSFPPSIGTSSAADEFSSPLSSDVISDTDNDLTGARDVIRDVRDLSCVASSLSKSLPIISIDTTTDSSSEVWQPWR